MRNLGMSYGVSELCLYLFIEISFCILSFTPKKERIPKSATPERVYFVGEWLFFVFSALRSSVNRYPRYDSHVVCVH